MVVVVGETRGEGAKRLTEVIFLGEICDANVLQLISCKICKKDKQEVDKYLISKCLIVLLTEIE